MYFFVLLDDTLNVTPLDSQEQSAVEEERPRFLQKGNSWTFRHFILTYYRHSFSNRHSPRKFFVSDYTKWTPSGTLYTFHILYTYYNFARMTIVIHRVLSIRLSMGSVKWAVFGGRGGSHWTNMSQPSSPLPIGDHSSASVNDSLRSRVLINSHGIVRRWSWLVLWRVLIMTNTRSIRGRGWIAWSRIIIDS